MSGRKLAAAVGMDSAAYVRSETGTRAFKASELIALADVMGLPLDTLVGRRSADQEAAIRRARAAAERVGGEVVTWVTAMNRSIDSLLSGLPASQKRDISSEDLARHIHALMPAPRTLTVLPGMADLFSKVLQDALPGQFLITDTQAV